MLAICGVIMEELGKTHFFLKATDQNHVDQSSKKV